MFSIDEEQNNDRELISEFLFYAKETQGLLQSVEKNNSMMKEIVHKQVYENKSANQEIKTDEINKLIQQNANY